jgi:hypothetical protein
MGRRGAPLARARARAQVFLPHARESGGSSASSRSCWPSSAQALALLETLAAKMRILLVPRLLAAGSAAALLGIASWLVGA